MDGTKHGLDGELEAIVKRIGALLARGHASGGRPDWPEIEMLLTDGYALALELESQRSRLRPLGADTAVVERDIRWLRSLLDELHLNGRRFRGRLAPTQTLAGRFQRFGRVDEKTRRKAPRLT